MADQSIEERVSKLGVEYRNALISKMAEVLDNRPSNAEPLNSRRETELWMLPTSPAATIALKQGATLAEAHQANAMWADHMAKQGAPEELIAETCRKFAYEQGKAAGRGDLKRETEYHEKMAERAAQLQPDGTAITTLDDGAGMGGQTDGGSSY